MNVDEKVGEFVSDKFEDFFCLTLFFFLEAFDPFLLAFVRERVGNFVDGTDGVPVVIEGNFQGCKDIESSKESSADGCIEGNFQGCKEIESSKESSADGCIDGSFEGCKEIEGSREGCVDVCIERSFEGCKEIKG